MRNAISIQTLNNLGRTDFVNTLGSVFEHSPWVAEQSFSRHPFDSVLALHNSMLETVNNASEQQRKALICNHPELAGREATARELTAASKNEQASAGLDHFSPQELQLFRLLNQQYRDKFGFPFIIAVKNLTRYDILDSIHIRLQNSTELEFNNCIQEIGKIAEFRLHQLIVN